MEASKAGLYCIAALGIAVAVSGVVKAVRYDGQPSRAEVSRAGSAHHSMGDTVTISATGDRNQWVALGVTEEALSEVTKAFIAKDWRGVAAMTLAGRVFHVDDGTHGILIDSTMFTRKVRVTEGPESGRAGWIPMEFAK
jgi:hypothetical protein